MKITIINGSPHKGNTWKLVEEAKEQLRLMEKSVEFHEIHLMKEKLPFCLGCSNCFRIGYEKCPHYGQMHDMMEKIEQADGVIIASTTFNMSETGLLKNFFDHLCFMLHRPHFFQSKALVITTTGGVGAKKAAKGICSMLKGIGFNRCYRFSTASYSWNDYHPNEKTKKALNKKTKKFYKDVKAGVLHAPSFSVLIPYNLFRGMSLAYVKGTEYETADGDFWTEEERRKYVYDTTVKVPIYKKAFGRMFYGIGKMARKFTMVTYKK